MQLGRVALFLCLQVDKLIYVKTGETEQQVKTTGQNCGKNYRTEPQDGITGTIGKIGTTGQIGTARGSIGLNDKTNYRIDLQKEL